MDERVGNYHHQDDLYVLHEGASLVDKLEALHRIVRGHFEFVERVAVAVYDAETDIVKTFLGSDNSGVSPIVRYEKRLSDSDSLSRIAESRRPRVANDLDVFEVPSPAGAALRQHGYGASYTMPMYWHGRLAGFVFFNARHKQAFTPRVLTYLNMIGHLLALTVVGELAQIKSLSASVRTATDFVRSRDFETGAHLERMAHYSRLIALEIAPRHDLDDSFIEQVFLFAPLHDIGKIAIADSILLKPGKLTSEEFETMKLHTVRGGEIIDAMLANFGLRDTSSATMLKNIALHHHEAINGSGYPHGMAEEAIPIEARITAVADVFDALTSQRPYKQAWSNEAALAELRQQSGGRLDRECVEALARCPDEIRAIQQRFAEDPLA